jgi:hypothetical protein
VRDMDGCHEDPPDRSDGPCGDRTRVLATTD